MLAWHARSREKVVLHQRFISARQYEPMISAKSADSPRFGELLRELRVAQGLSQEELAERAAMSVNGISALERGANQTPQRKTLELLVQALELCVEDKRALEAAAMRRSRPRALTTEAVAVEGLPRALTPLFGREDDVCALIALVGEAALVTLAGPGGIGKTRLALRAAELLSEDVQGRVRFVDLGPLRDAEAVDCAIASHADALRCKPGLLIVDNCEHVATTAAVAIGAVLQSHPDLHVLTTSRQSLNLPGEHVYRVSPLSLEPAIELFAERAHRASGAFAVTPENRDAIARICMRLDGIALAIELAAARMKLLTLEQLEVRLTERFQLLTGGSELMLPRHQTMRATIDWSYDLLTEREQHTLSALALFPGSFSLDAALAVCADPSAGEWTLLDAVQSLVDKSLLVRGVGGDLARYRMLETTRAYVAGRSPETEDARRLRDRHLKYYAEMARKAQTGLASTTSTAAWARALEPDFENFLSAVDWAFWDGCDGAAGATILCGLQEFWIVQGFAAEIARRAQDALRSDGELARMVCGQLWLTLARMRQELFVHPEQTLEAARRAEALFDGTEDRDGVALALRQQAAAHMRLGAFDDARAEFERSIEIYRELGDRRMVARGLGYIASLWQVQGSYERARTTLLDVLDLARAMGDDRMIPTVVMNLAETEFALGDVQSAASRALENLSSEMLRKSCDMLATQESNLSAYLLALGRTREARAMALRSIGDASGSFPAVPLQHFAATVPGEQAKTAARLLGYVEEVFRRTAFSREHTERFTYERLMTTLRNAMDDACIASCLQEGALMNAEQILHLAREVAEPQSCEWVM